jgi:mycothiol synthase
LNGLSRAPRRLGSKVWNSLRFHEPPGLTMIYVAAAAPTAALPPEYSIRTWQPGDDPAWLQLLNENAAFGPWTTERLDRENESLVYEAQFFIVHEGRLVATTGIYDRTLHGRPAWEVGWVAVDSRQRGRGLGRAVVATAVGAALALPERPIFLSTDSFRLPAIAIYLELGFVPELTTHAGYPARWEAVFGELARYRAANST